MGRYSFEGKPSRRAKVSSVSQCPAWRAILDLRGRSWFEMVWSHAELEKSALSSPPSKSRPNLAFEDMNLFNNNVSFSRAPNLKITFLLPHWRKHTKLSFWRHKFIQWELIFLPVGPRAPKWKITFVSPLWRKHTELGSRKHQFSRRAQRTKMEGGYLYENVNLASVL